MERHDDASIADRGTKPRAAGLLLAAGVLLVAGSIVWVFWVGKRWTDRITPGWSWEGHFIGFNTYPDPETGELPAEDTVNTYFYRTEIVPDSWQGRSVVLRSRWVTHDLETGEVTWEYAIEVAVDPRTGRYLSGPLRGAHHVFPRGVEKKTYPIFYSSTLALPYAFESEEMIEGLETWVFAHRGSPDATEFYAATDDFPGVDVEPGQVIRCAGDQRVGRYWVEPVTGETVKTADSCLTGDAVHDLRTGERLSWVARWSGGTASDELLRLVEQARVARRDYLRASRDLPAGLLFAGLAAFVAGIVRGKR